MHYLAAHCHASTSLKRVLGYPIHLGNCLSHTSSINVHGIQTPFSERKLIGMASVVQWLKFCSYTLPLSIQLGKSATYVCTMYASMPCLHRESTDSLIGMSIIVQWLFQASPIQLKSLTYVGGLRANLLFTSVPSRHKMVPIPHHDSAENYSLVLQLWELENLTYSSKAPSHYFAHHNVGNEDDCQATKCPYNNIYGTAVYMLSSF